MTHIHFDAEAVDSANLSLRSVIAKLDQVCESLTVISTQIDYRVSSQRGIAAQLRRINNIASSALDGIAGIHRWAETSVNEYRSAEKQTAKKVENIKDVPYVSISAPAPIIQQAASFKSTVRVETPSVNSGTYTPSISQHSDLPHEEEFQPLYADEQELNPVLIRLMADEESSTD